MRTLLLAFALLLPALAAAQDTRPVRCRLLLFGAEDSASLLTTSDKGTETTCLLSNSSLSASVTYTAVADKITFLSPGDRKPAATASVPAAVKAALLIFVKAPASEQSAQPWRVIVIEDSLKNFPDGGAFVANFYNKDIRFIIGEHKGQLRPAGNHGYPLPAERDAFNMAPVTFEFLQNENWRTASESTLRFLPGMRYLIFAYVDPASGRPRISTIQDLTPPATVP